MSQRRRAAIFRDLPAYHCRVAQPITVTHSSSCRYMESVGPIVGEASSRSPITESLLLSSSLQQTRPYTGSAVFPHPFTTIRRPVPSTPPTRSRYRARPTRTPHAAALDESEQAGWRSVPSETTHILSYNPETPAKTGIATDRGHSPCDGDSGDVTPGVSPGPAERCPVLRAGTTESSGLTGPSMPLVIAVLVALPLSPARRAI